MYRSSIPMLATLALLALPMAARAQHGHGGGPPLVTTAPHEASQFDFLVGQWELKAKPHMPGLAARIHGVPDFPGTWKAWRSLDGWGLEDEIRLTDASGNPRGFTHSVRAYDANARRWNIVGLDVYRSTFQMATAEWKDGAMHSTAKGTDGDGRAYVSRTRFFDIGPSSFRMQQDRSYDDGKTWTEKFLVVEAKRTAATASR